MYLCRDARGQAFVPWQGPRQPVFNHHRVARNPTGRRYPNHLQRERKTLDRPQWLIVR